MELAVLTALVGSWAPGRRALGALACGVALAAPARAQQRTDTISLDDAIARALQVNPTVVRASGDLRSAHAGVRTADAEYLPRLDLQSNAIRATFPSPVAQPGALNGLADRTASAGFSATLDVFTGGRRGADRRRASADADASSADLVNRRADATLAAKQAYFETLRTAELTREAEARVARAQEGVAEAKLRHDVGTSTGSDELRARLELSDAKVSRIQAASDHRVAQVALARVVGHDGPLEARGIDSLVITPLPDSPAALLDEIERNTPAVRAADAAARSATAGLSAARSTYLPSLQLTGGYVRLNTPSAGLLSNPPLWALQLGLAFPVFDGLVREERWTRAVAANDAARADLVDIRRAARSDGARALEAIQVAESRMALADEAVRVAREDLRVVTARYRAGAATILDRITSQLNLATEETQQITARYDYLLARAQLEALLGRAP